MPTQFSEVASKTSSARCALGTLVRVGAAKSRARAFARMEDLAHALSRFEPDSDVSQINSTRAAITLSSDVVRLLHLAEGIERRSEKAFTIGARLAWPGSLQVRRLEGSLDLNGIAKGFIVDEMVAVLEVDNARGSVNAGGDVRVWGPGPHVIHLQLGSAGVRTLTLPRAAAVATSAPFVTHNLPESSTRYDRKFSKVTATAIAAQAAVADALTKVALFSPHARDIAAHYGARLLVFAEDGRLLA